MDISLRASDNLVLKIASALTFVLVVSLQPQMAQGAPSKSYKLFIGVVSEFWTSYGESPEEVSKTSKCESYDSVREGTSVKIRDAKRKIIGASILKWRVIDVRRTEGPIKLKYEPGVDLLPYEGICALVAVIPKLPRTSFYEVLLGKVEGGVYSFSDLRKQKWQLTLTID